MTDSPNSPRPGDPGTEEGAEETGRPTVRDKRRIDPQTYQLRDPESAGSAQSSEEAGVLGAESTPAAGAPADTAPADGVTAENAGTTDAEVNELKSQLADRTADLQRVQAEYVNYKRRVDRDRDLARAAGIEAVLTELLPVLDTIKAAREHGELTGGFKGVAEEVERIATRHGLESFGEAGDPFDPRIHEALMNAQAEGITVTTCVTILQPGYKIKDRVVRPARVAVAEPDPSAAAAPTSEPTAPTTEQPNDSSEGSPSDGSNSQA